MKHYQDFADANWGAFVAGFIAAFIVAYLTIKLFLAFIQRFTFVAFGIYRITFWSDLADDDIIFIEFEFIESLTGVSLKFKKIFWT